MENVKKRYQQQMFFTSAIVAFFILVSGIALGMVLDRYKVDDSLSSLRQNELNAESYFLEQQLIEGSDIDKCEIAKPRAQALSEELVKLGNELSNYKESSLFKKNDYDYLLRRYFLLEIRTYSLFKDIRSECEDATNTIIFFYRIDDDSSVKQGYALDEVVRQNPDVSVFSFDIDYKNEPLISTIKLGYDISDAPTIIINDEQVMQGFSSVEKITDILRK